MFGSTFFKGATTNLHDNNDIKPPNIITDETHNDVPPLKKVEPNTRASLHIYYHSLLEP